MVMQAFIRVMLGSLSSEPPPPPLLPASNESPQVGLQARVCDISSHRACNGLTRVLLPDAAPRSHHEGLQETSFQRRVALPRPRLRGSKLLGSFAAHILPNCRIPAVTGSRATGMEDMDAFVRFNRAVLNRREEAY